MTSEKKRNKEFYENQFKRVAPCDEKLGKKPFGVRLPEDVTEQLEEMPRADRIALMRNAITNAVRGINQADHL